MAGSPANALNINQTGIVTFDGIATFTGSTVTQHGVLLGGASNAVSSTAVGTTGQVLQANTGADPTYSTATFPSTASSTGTILRSNGTNWVATTATYPTTTTINQLLYSSSASVIGGLATANSAILNTSSGGVPSLATSPSCSGTLTAGTGLTATSGNITATAGDVIITSGKMTLPTTTSTVGLITIGGVVFMHAKGTNSTFLGNNAGSLSNTGSGNTGVGFEALLNVSSAQFNTCLGAFSGYNGAFTGTGNTFLGYGTGSVNSSGNYNVGCGYTSLTNVTTGQYNTCIGYNAGQQYTSSESSNVLVGASGTTGESNVMRLGTTGSGNGQVSSCFVAGVTGVTVTGTAVLCSATGQFGTVASSERYKENIEDMPKSITILNLRPIKFTYKSDEEKRTQYGLLAEDVHRVFPYLCHYNEENQPESVKYHEICVFLLAEIQKMDKRVKQLEAKNG